MGMIFSFLGGLYLAAGIITATAGAGAEHMVTLEVVGNIRNFSDPARRLFQLTPTQFHALPQYSITTATSWTPVVTFSGVKMEDLMQAAGAQGSYAMVYGENTGFGKNRALSHFTRYCGTPTAEIVHRRSSDSDARRNLRSD